MSEDKMEKIQISIDAETQKNIDNWLNAEYDEQTKAEIRRLQQENPQELINAFYTKLEFGTGGLRGVMGVGPNRMNNYTVRGATQGLANYLKLQFPKEKTSVLIGYDSRHHSKEFAQECAQVLAGNEVEVYLYNELRPVPLVSFGVLNKHCNAGIMITASHNPPEYNGYKAYWSNGAQVLPPHDTGIINEVNKITHPSLVKLADANSPLIHHIGDEIDQFYLKATFKLQHYLDDNQKNGKNLKIIYTPLHGAGITMVPKALANWGFTNVSIVEQQKNPDGDFPTVETPNPEERSALKIGIEKLVKEQADILIGTDPDTDRMGIVVMHKNEPILLNGNQIACICLEHVCNALQTSKKMPAKPMFIKTIVTTELFKAICDAYHVSSLDVLTGFKYIGEKIDLWSKNSNDYQFIFGGEESYGYLLGTHARDKDAVISADLIAEAALHMKLQGKTLIDLLDSMYQKYGVFREKLLSLTLKGREGAEKIHKMMNDLRQHPPTNIGGKKVVKIEDYQTHISKDLVISKTEKIDLPESNVLRFWLEDGTKLVIRPSGTEPKIKIYAGVYKKAEPNLLQTISECDKKLDDYLNAIQQLIHGI